METLSVSDQLPPTPASRSHGQRVRSWHPHLWATRPSWKLKLNQCCRGLCSQWGPVTPCQGSQDLDGDPQGVWAVPLAQGVFWELRLWAFCPYKEPDLAQSAQHPRKLPASHPAPGATQTLAGPPHPAHPRKP